jgi:hypothetical protein
MILAASEYLTEEAVKDMQQSDCYALMVDESTDVSVNKLLIVYIKYITPSNTVCTRFLSNVEVPDGAADTIYQAIRDLLELHKIPFEKMIAFASDGASVMTGIHTGVAAQLKERLPHIFSVHCIAHRLQLASIDSVNEDRSFSQFESTLKHINSYFSRSTSRLHELRSIQEECKDPILKLLGIADTRWLSNYESVQRVKDIFNSLLSFFKKEDPTGTYKQICKFRYNIKYLLIMYKINCIYCT